MRRNANLILIIQTVLGVLTLLATIRSEDPDSILSYKATAMYLLVPAITVYAINLISWKCRQSVKEKMAELILPAYILTDLLVILLVNTGVLLDNVYSEMRKEQSFVFFT